MLHTTNIFCTFILILCIATFGGVSTDTQGTGILYTENKRLCRNITWKLESHAVFVNLTTVLKKGDGQERKVETEVLKSGLVNITTAREICCPGFFKNNRGRCKKCPKGTYGLDCLNLCDCTGFKKCDRRTGECKKCIERTCEDDDGGDDDDDNSTVSTKDNSTTPRPQSTENSSAPSTAISATEADHGIEYNITTVHPCEICKQYGNCSNLPDCAVSAGRGSNIKKGLGKGHTILIAVVLSLAILTILLITCIVLRERNHRKQKQKIKESVLIKFSSSDETTEYVDPEPVYSEIKEEEIGVRNGNCYKPNLPDRPVNNEYYKLPEAPEAPEVDENIETDECGYLNPYTALRFARSESNLFRDRDLRVKGTYDMTYSLAKAIQRDDNSSPQDHGDLDKLINDSSAKDERSSDVPVYFVLEKNANQTESHYNPEREKLLKRESKLRSSI